MKKIILTIGVLICTFGVKADEVATSVDKVYCGIFNVNGAGISYFGFSTKNLDIGMHGNSCFVVYKEGGFSMHVTNYWNEEKFALNEKSRFETGIGFKLFPLKVSGNIMFNENQVTSTKLETSYPFVINDIQWKAAVGITPWNRIHSMLGIDNISLQACKNIPISERFVIPLLGQIDFNPQIKNVVLSWGVSVQCTI